MKFNLVISPEGFTADELRDILDDVTGESTGGNDGEFDANNMPWDERIHAATKTRTAKGLWKKRKGVDDATIAAVESELRGAPAAAPAVTTPALSVAQKLDKAESALRAPSAPVAPQPPAAVAAPVPPAPQPPAAVAPPAPPAPPAPVARNFEGLMQRISGLFQQQRIEPTYPQTIVDRIGTAYNIPVGDITAIANEPAYVEYAHACMDADIDSGYVKAA
jgi:hypothetical protein